MQEEETVRLEKNLFELGLDFAKLKTDSAGTIEKLARAIAYIIEKSDYPLTSETVEMLRKTLKEI